MLQPDRIDRCSGCRIAGNDHRLRPGVRQKCSRRQRAGNDLCLAAFAVGGEAGVGQVQQLLGGQGSADVAQHRQATDAGVEHADRAPATWRRHRMQPVNTLCALPLQATETGILPTEDLVIRSCHSAGPVVCTEVPVASTATVTGMSWTSNS